MTATAFVCPVCELPMLAAPPEKGPVCPACGTQFEVDDRYRSHEQLKEAWIADGAQWFSSRVKPPEHWEEYRFSLLVKFDQDLDTPPPGPPVVRAIDADMRISWSHAVA